MKILITGANGQLGMDVLRLFSKKGHEVVGLNRTQLDITDEKLCSDTITELKPDTILHCAAYTAVDNAEKDIDSAYLVNAIGTRNIAAAAERVKAKVCYISTDYVFDGTNTSPYYEYDNTNPLTVYGKSKRAGEQLVQFLCSRWFIVRTSWVYGATGTNFVNTMVKLGKECDCLQVVNDQWGSPTYTWDLALFLEKLVASEKYGIYHASNTGICTWYEFAQAIFELSNIPVIVEPCTTEQFQRPATRPRYSAMESMAIRVNGFDPLRSWREALKEYINKDILRIGDE
ncbi:dTDP-4-dehydrorhamnose reductase [Paenibacillus alvei]|uniref:dTDP-4-dehydrorhamnose reductase n=1 Tax=Paenibacillus alvei TaxID=44250 RepID=D6QW68_PAEAL|nr:dTDP-4-dehydrorhamnose reductase [Paenibacillus alvei]ADG29297.1 putative dTDP-4-dehydrorhamnose reductase [Paenibacillus alvei]EJW18349.1 spore coat polysaccharide biosynthesis protein SpsK [Paenibacillus alvei DSM 29]MCY9542858.1 dTDP-4-dehydrorhamnose reductase [Paenibacillus alvei]MCY9703047.1 dTDP-4-dehydrorhamnose reductase [Paenibacillus alvei]MCY9735730.1 dTDP-4-dehydrorhamnose reductase [Paenibacillus alvei]